MEDKRGERGEGWKRPEREKEGSGEGNGGQKGWERRGVRERRERERAKWRGGWRTKGVREKRGERGEREEGNGVGNGGQTGWERSAYGSWEEIEEREAVRWEKQERGEREERERGEWRGKLSTQEVREERGEREETIWELRGDSGEKSSALREIGKGWERERKGWGWKFEDNFSRSRRARRALRVTKRTLCLSLSSEWNVCRGLIIWLVYKNMGHQNWMLKWLQSQFWELRSKQLSQQFSASLDIMFVQMYLYLNKYKRVSFGLWRIENISVTYYFVKYFLCFLTETM